MYSTATRSYVDFREGSPIKTISKFKYKNIITKYKDSSDMGFEVGVMFSLL